MGMKRRFGAPLPRERQTGKNPLWYKDAVIYEVRVRSFYDSNGDGIGDFRGLAGKLDYLQDLGVTAIWMLPFYPSPMRDDGYDIADYTDIQPECGTLADFDFLLEEAHRRGLRVVTELVLNHTSDRHPWFRRARLAAPGSVERDFYVWSDTPERYREARIIFKDFEPSNWAWDAGAKAYYWHRFFAHQPDLNFASPAVHEALLGVVDFWLAKGVDGLRLDAVPYLFEAEGTNCENLPATHDFLRTLRAHIDSKFEDRMLLAEANQWPEDAAAYFGTGDECHMNFHFPIMPRMFMAIHMEDRFPLLDILAQTPAIPDNCQWALFLRNHDELTLEMVTDEERDYMYRAYANDAEMRINLGIRRRLAPLVGNDRRKMELLYGLLLSLPGTPVLYYGDEIGMGDNIFLGDRNGVRTPMQWSADRNAGFSRANPQRLILPITIDPEYHYEAINVEAQQNNPNSLLWWTKRILALRKQFQAFGRGTIEFLTPSNHRVLAFIRQYGDETVLVVANLSRFAQYVELDLSKWKGTHPVELTGYTEFPAIGEVPYLMTVGGHAFYWFSLEAPASREEIDSAAAYRPPVLDVATWESALAGPGRSVLEEILPGFVTSRRWFAGRDARVVG
ncbi:MAG TPA: maltose alpha-D-glucosyltransferase, partial [Polyangia bacterium]|nr:maltose alpha-D-glucosyltransferase [Polyangia bacterium]